MSQYETNNVSATEQVAAELARGLRPGDCIALEGDLGAGKTQFVRGLVIGLNGDARQVSSPTYVLLHLYGDPARQESVSPAQRLPVYHLDAYRATADELDAIGFLELLDQGGVVVVEWASRVSKLLPAETIWVTIAATGETARRIEIRKTGQEIRMTKFE